MPAGNAAQARLRDLVDDRLGRQRQRVAQAGEAFVGLVVGQ